MTLTQSRKTLYLLTGRFFQEDVYSENSSRLQTGGEGGDRHGRRKWHRREHRKTLKIILRRIQNLPKHRIEVRN